MREFNLDKIKATDQVRIVKAWIYLNMDGGGIHQSYNVSSVSDQGTGKFYVNFGENMAADNYCVVTGSYSASSISRNFAAGAYPRGVTYFEVMQESSSGGGFDHEVSAVVFAE